MIKPFRKGRHVVLILTPSQAEALRSLVSAANHDRDHEDWLKSAQASPGEIRATRDCMQLTLEAAQIGANIRRPRQ